MKKTQTPKLDMKKVYEAALYHEANYSKGIDIILEAIGKKDGFFYDSAARCWIEECESEQEMTDMLIKLGYGAK